MSERGKHENKYKDVNRIQGCSASLPWVLLAGLVQRLCQGLEKSSISPVKCDSLQHERVTQAECGVRKITQSA